MPIICFVFYVKLKDMAEKVPPEVGNNLKAVLNQADNLLRDKGSKTSKVSSSMLMDSLGNGQPYKTSQWTADIEYERTHQLQNAPEGSVQHNGKLVATDTREATGHQSMESNSSNRGVEVVEQFEHGVYVTLIQNPDGTKDFKRVRFRYSLISTHYKSMHTYFISF